MYFSGCFLKMFLMGLLLKDFSSVPVYIFFLGSWACLFLSIISWFLRSIIYSLYCGLYLRLMNQKVMLPTKNKIIMLKIEKSIHWLAFWDLVAVAMTKMAHIDK